MTLPMHYASAYEWTGTAEAGTLTIEGHPPLPVGSPHDAARYSPEHLLLAAAEICLCNTYLAIAGLSKLETQAYRSTAEGELEFIPKEGYRFKRILIRPVITVAASEQDRATRIIEKAHKACLVARSLNCAVEIEPEILGA